MTSHLYNGKSELHYCENGEVNLLTLKKFPVKMGVFKDIKDYAYEDLNFIYNKITGLFYVKPLIDPSFLYSNYHNAGTIGFTWKKHHEEFASYISLNSRQHSEIMEVGGASGILRNHIISLFDCNYCIVDPTINAEKVPIINEIFDADKIYGHFDLIIHSHTLEHLINPINFMKGIHKNLTKNGLMIGSIPNMHSGLLKGFTNSLMFEHHYFIDNDVLRFILSKAGFSLIDSHQYLEHSIFFTAQKSEYQSEISSVQSSDRELLATSYVKKIINKVDSVRSIIESNKDSVIYLFGAHIFSQLYLSQINQNHFKGVLDNDSTKWGGRLYGYDINVLSPSEANLSSNDIVIVDAGFYSDEIINDLIKRDIKPRFIKL